MAQSNSILRFIGRKFNLYAFIVGFLLSHQDIRLVISLSVVGFNWTDCGIALCIFLLTLRLLLDSYPTDLCDAQRVDEVMDATEDLAHKFVPTMMLPAGPERLAKRKELAEGTLLFCYCYSSLSVRGSVALLFYSCN